MGVALLPLSAAPGSAKRINVAREHSALSGPTQTTTQTTTPVDGADSDGFDFSRAASVLTDAASKAGAAIMAHFHAAMEVKLKDDNSPVTQRRPRLRGDYPRSAEHGSRPASGGLGGVLRRRSAHSPRRFFLVDPLDGTKEFIQRRSDFTVNVALIEDGRPSFGLVYAPARALLAVTVAKGNAVSKPSFTPSASGADFSQLR